MNLYPRPYAKQKKKKCTRGTRDKIYRKVFVGNGYVSWDENGSLHASCYHSWVQIGARAGLAAAGIGDGFSFYA